MTPVERLVLAARTIIDGDLDPDMGLVGPGLFHEAAPTWMRELREAADEVAAQPKIKPTGDAVLDAALLNASPAFEAWARQLPAAYWARYDLSACRIGWEARVVPPVDRFQIAPLTRTEAAAAVRVLFHRPFDSMRWDDEAAAPRVVLGQVSLDGAFDGAQLRALADYLEACA